MARISGVEIPNKRMEVALTYIFGIGKPSARQILNKLAIDANTKTQDLNERDLTRIRDLIEKEYTIEGSLKGQVRASIQRLTEINCYRGIRHRRGLPVRGQRTRTNAHSRKGRRGKAVANKKILK